MNKKHTALIIIAIFLFSAIALNVSAGIFDTVLDNMNEFFTSGWQRYDALLSFTLIFILLFSAAYAGLKKAFGDDKTKSRPAIGIALAFAAIGAIGIVSGFGFRIERYGYLALGFLLLMLVFVIYSVLLKLGLEKHKLLAFLIALIIVGIIFLVSYSIMEGRGIRLGGLTGPSVGGGRGLGTSIKSIFGGKKAKEAELTAEQMNKQLDSLTELEKNIESLKKYEKECEGKNKITIEEEEINCNDLKDKINELEKQRDGLKESTEDYPKNLAKKCLKHKVGSTSVLNIINSAVKRVTDNKIEEYKKMLEDCKNAHSDDEIDQKIIEKNRKIAQQSVELYSDMYGTTEDQQLEILANFIKKYWTEDQKTSVVEDAIKQADNIAKNQKGGRLKLAQSYFDIGSETKDNDFLNKAYELADRVEKDEGSTKTVEQVGKGELTKDEEAAIRLKLDILRAQESMGSLTRDKAQEIAAELIGKLEKGGKKVCPQGEHWDYTKENCVPDEEKPGEKPKEGGIKDGKIYWDGEWREKGYQNKEGKIWNGKGWVKEKEWKKEQKAEEKEQKTKEEKRGFPWWILIIILVLLGGGGFFGYKKIRKKKPEEVTPPTLDEQLKNLKNAIKSTQEQKNKVLQLIEKTKTKETKDLKKFLTSIKRFKDLLEKKYKGDVAWLIDIDKKSQLNKDLNDEELADKSLLADEYTSEEELLKLMLQEKILEKIYSELIKMENLDPQLKTQLPPKMQLLGNIIKIIENGIKNNKPHLKKEVFTEEHLKNILDPNITKPEERIKPTWEKYKEADEKKIEQYVKEDKAFCDTLKNQIKEEKTILNQISNILAKKKKELEEEEEELKVTIADKIKVEPKEAEVARGGVPEGTELTFTGYMKGLAGDKPYETLLQINNKWLEHHWKNCEDVVKYKTNKLREGTYKIRLVVVPKKAKESKPNWRDYVVAGGDIEIKINKTRGEITEAEKLTGKEKEKVDIILIKKDIEKLISEGKIKETAAKVKELEKIDADVAAKLASKIAKESGKVEPLSPTTTTPLPKPSSTARTAEEMAAIAERLRRTARTPKEKREIDELLGL